MQEDFRGDIELVNEDMESGQLSHPSEIDATVGPEEEYDSLNEIIQKSMNDSQMILLKVTKCSLNICEKH